MALFLMLLVPVFGATIPDPIGGQKCLVIGNYNPDGDFGHPSGMGVVFDDRAPTNWTFAFSGIDYKPADGVTCMGWTNDVIYPSTELFQLALASNFSLVIFYGPSAQWTIPIPPTGDWNDPLHYVTIEGVRWATEHGISVFCPHYDNTHIYRDMIAYRGPQSLILVGGSLLAFNYPNTGYSYGPQLEFGDARLNTDAAESWANQATAARFARIMDAHPTYNNYDIRAYVRQASKYYTNEWTYTGGFGFPSIPMRIGDDTNLVEIVVETLEPQPPLEILTTYSGGGQVHFYWRNFLMTGWQSTVIKLGERVLYEGEGNDVTRISTAAFGRTIETPEKSFSWTPDVFGNNTFTFQTKANDVYSRIETFASVTLVLMPPVANVGVSSLGVGSVGSSP